MPKDEFDFEDPLELCGVGIATDEDTTEFMAECFAEEFMRLGYNHRQVMALFKDPRYTGVNMVLQNRGEAFVRDTISAVFARWGRTVSWPALISDPTSGKETEAIPREPSRPEQPLSFEPADDNLSTPTQGHR